MTEDDLLGAVMDLAKFHRWLAFHPLPAMNVRGRWLTAARGDVGSPDIWLARDGQVLGVELKSQTGGFRPGQKEWGAALGDHWRLWRPSDVEEIKGALR